MASEDPLYQLVRSMGRREKQLFKLQAANHSRKGGNKYVDAFDLINKHRAQGDKEITSKLEKQASGENLGSLKNYLLETIAKILSTHSKQFRVTQKIRKIQDEAHVLRDRGIFEHAIKLLLKAKKMAISIGRYDLVRSILETERTIIGSNRGELFGPEKIHELMEEQMQVSKMLVEEALAKKVYYKCFNRTYRSTDKKKHIQLLEYLNDPDFANIENSEHPNALMYFHCAWAQYYHFLGENLLAEQRHRKILAIFETMPAMAQESPYFLNSTLHNVMSQMMLRRDLSEIVALMEVIWNVEFSVEIEQIKQFETISSFALFYSAQTVQNLNGTKWQIVIDDFPEYKNRISSSFLIDYRMKRSIYYFNFGDYNKAASWSLENLNDDKLKRMPLHQTFNHLVFLMAHFKLGNQELVSSRAASRLRAEKTKAINFKFYKLMLNLFVKLFEKQLDTKEIIRAAIEQLIEIQKEESYTAYLELDLWLSSLLKNESLTELIAEKTKSLPRIP